jgi:hypothetical protein
MKIIVEFIRHPIPDRKYDWTAYVDGDEELRLNGYGSTWQEAVKEMLENYEMSDT